MTDIATSSTSLLGAEAGKALATDLQRQMSRSPDAVIVFASPANDYETLLDTLQSGCTPGALVGCSSAGEFTRDVAGTGLTTAIAISADDMRFTAVLTTDLSRGRERAATALVSRFTGLRSEEFRYRTAVVLIDALAGHAEDFVAELTRLTGGGYRFVGGGAGDDARFKKTHVFCGSRAYSDAAVALEILSNKPFGIGARHGWTPASEPLRVTESSQSCVVSLNVTPAAEVFEEHADRTGQRFDRSDPMPFFLHNIVGVRTDEGHRLRVPLGVTDAGGVVCAAEVPTGATAHIMTTAVKSASEAAAVAARDAMAQVRDGGAEPKAALFFDCVATRLRLGQAFDDELSAVQRELQGVPFVGFNSYGQIVRADGQFSGFHNCTAVAFVIPA